MLSINTNLAAQQIHRSMDGTAASLDTALRRLSSGLRINSAKDDAAGLAVAERMTSQVNGLNQSARNANDGISLAQAAEGALAGSASLLQRLRELAVQSANSTNSATDRIGLNREAAQLIQELDRAASTASFNGQQLLGGNFGVQQFQVGAGSGQTLSASLGNFRAASIGQSALSWAVDAVTRASVGGANAVAGGTLNVTSTQGAVTMAIGVGASARNIATTVNAQTEVTGVSASAQTDVGLTFGITPGSYSFGLISRGGRSVSFSFNLALRDGQLDLQAATDAINAKVDTTGVTARVGRMNGEMAIVLNNDLGDDVALVKPAGVANTGNISVGHLIHTTLYPGTQAVAGVDESIAYGEGSTLAAASSPTASTYVIPGTLVFAADAAFTINDGPNSMGGSGVTYQSDLFSVAAADLSTVFGATQAMSVFDTALAMVDRQRAGLGALQSRLESAVSNLRTTSENLSAARSRVTDADFAQETANLSRTQILQSASQALLAQANQYPQGVLALIR